MVLAPLLVVALLLSVVGWLAGPPLWAAWRRSHITARPFPSAWRAILRQRFALYRRLPVPLQRQLQRHVQVLVAQLPFIGCQGQVITDEVRVLVSAQAALLLLGRPAGSFRGLRQVLVYPGAFVVARETADGNGLTHATRRALAGESWQQGQVLLSWDDVLAGAADPWDGQNVVLHEFAHQLDQETGPANGAPWLRGRERRVRWARVMNNEYERLCECLALGEPSLLGSYAASAPAEFFAVATELFFERPLELARAHAALYSELQQLYRVDPLHWVDSSPLLNPKVNSDAYPAQRPEPDACPLRP